jgi:hypothetical protein
VSALADGAGRQAPPLRVRLHASAFEARQPTRTLSATPALAMRPQPSPATDLPARSCAAISPFPSLQLTTNTMRRCAPLGEMRLVACRRRPEPLASSRPQLRLASLFADRSQPLVATQAAPAATTGARDFNLKCALACSLHGNPGSVLASDAALSDTGLEVLRLRDGRRTNPGLPKADGASIPLEGTTSLSRPR